MLSSEFFGVGLALALILLLWLFLPRPSRHLARQPALFLALHLATRLVARFLPGDTAPGRIAGLVALMLLLVSIGRSGVLLVVDIALGRRLLRPLPRIVRDIVQGVVYLAVLLAVLRMAGVEPASLLTTSALLTAVIALSLQETLGNLVAGLAIQVQRPFDVGDWIQFDAEPKHIGRVVEINWRATKVITLDDVEVIIPNSTLAKAAITNFTKPTATSRRSLFVHVPADVPPHLVERTILEALPGSFGLVDEPPPSVVNHGLVEGNVEYWIRFFTDRFHLRDGVDGAARDRVWYALSRAGIPVAAPGRFVRMSEVSGEARTREEQAYAARRAQALQGVDFLRALPEERLSDLSAQSQLRLYGEGEAIVHQGDQTAEMFIVEAGEVSVQVEQPKPHEVARLGPGSFFGEMALMTGEPRNATVRAARPCRLIVIDDKAMRAVLEAAPELAEHVCGVIAERQTALARAATRSAEEQESVQERSSVLLGRLKKFLSL